MNYLNIKVNSLAYSKLSNEEKIKVVKSKLNSMFNSNAGKLITVIHNGVKKSIPSNMFGEYKDLCERERKLEKNNYYYYDYDVSDSSSDGEKVLSHSSEYFTLPSINSLISKEDASTEKAKKGTSGFVAPNYDQFIYEKKYVETKKENTLKMPNIGELVDEKRTTALGAKEDAFRMPEKGELSIGKKEPVEAKKEDKISTIAEVPAETKTPVEEAKKENTLKMPNIGELVDEKRTTALGAKEDAFRIPEKDELSIGKKPLAVETKKEDKKLGISEVATETKTPMVETKKENTLRMPNIGELVDEKRTTALGVKEDAFRIPEKDELSTETKTPVEEAKVYGTKVTNETVSKASEKEINNKLVDDEDYTDVWKEAFGIPEKSKLATENKPLSVEHKKEDKKLGIFEVTTEIETPVGEDIVDEIKAINGTARNGNATEKNKNIDNKLVDDVDYTDIWKAAFGTPEKDELSTKNKPLAVETKKDDKKLGIFEVTTEIETPVREDIVDEIKAINGAAHNVAEKNKNIDNVLVDDVDYTDVWKEAFRKRDLALGRQEKVRTVQISKKYDEKYHNYKNGDDDDDLSLIWRPLFNKNIKRETTNVVESNVSQDKNINDTIETTDNKKDKKKGFVAAILAIPFIKKIRDRKKTVLNPIEDRTNKKRNLKITALALALAATTVVCSLVPGLSKKKSRGIGNNKTSETIVYDEPSVVEPTEEDIIIEEPTVVEPTEEDTIIEEPTVVEPTEEDTIVEEPTEEDNTYTENNYSFSFDDKVTIDDNSYIYYSSYDAAYENNNLTPLFDGSYERDIMGIVYNLDGKIITIYSSDPEAYNKAQDLIDSGATEEAVLVTRSDLVYTGQYEGYYNKDDVKVLTRKIG